MEENEIPDIYCVRANGGRYAENFVTGKYVGIGWLPEDDLSKIEDKEEIRSLYREYAEEDESEYVIGQQVGQIARFLFDIDTGDYVITPSIETEFVYWGVVTEEGYYYEKDPDDGCPYPHRKKVKWNKEPIQRSEFSVPLQNTIRSSLTVFYIDHKKSFFDVIGKPGLVPLEEKKVYENTTEMVLNKILELDYKEFEILVTELLSALGFEAEHVGRVGDGGVDARGELDVSNIAKIKVYVQAKRYRKNGKISNKEIKKLRANVPTYAQGAFITTADFNKGALKTAIESGFPRIGTINGEQLVDLLTDHWDHLSPEMREKLELKRGLVPK